MTLTACSAGASRSRAKSLRGDGRGRDLGYPTANMMLDPASELRQGIYAVHFLAADGVLRAGVASYGRRPTFGGGEPRA